MVRVIFLDLNMKRCNMLLEFTDYNFKVPSVGLTIIDFWSPWCRPCNSLNPVIKTLSENNTDVTVGKLNTIENPAIANQFSVSAIPTILFFKDGRLAKRLLGYHTEAQLQKCINELKL